MRIFGESWIQYDGVIRLKREVYILGKRGAWLKVIDGKFQKVNSDMWLVGKVDLYLILWFDQREKSWCVPWTWNWLMEELCPYDLRFNGLVLK